MTTFRQKYSIVAFLEDIPEGYEFDYMTWPLHITLADVFAVDDIERAVSNLLAADELSAVSTKTTTRGFLGPDNSHPVVFVDKTDELYALHRDVVAVLEKNGVIFNDPQYVKDGFLPHITDQAHAQTQTGQLLTIDHLAVVDMFPASDGYARKVIAKIAL